MRTQITDTQIHSYREDGFLHVPGFLSPDEVAELKAAVIEATTSMGKRKLTGADAAWDEGENYYDRVFTQRLNLWRISDTVKRYMFNRDLGRAMCQLEGIDGIRVWHDQALIKEPFGNPTAFHLDNPYWSFYSRHSISIWIALEDATLTNGCMYFVPGTHKVANFENVEIGRNIGGLFTTAPAMAGVDPVAVPMKAGDCSFHNGLTAHGAGANMTRGRRIAMTCAYMPEGSTFNGQPNILPRAYVDQLNIGDVLNSDEQNPLIYSAASAPQDHPQPAEANASAH